VEVDAGLLAAFDNSPVEPEAYSSNLPSHLLDLTLTSTHHLISTLFQLPTTSTASGLMVQLPAAKTLLPREKPLPKPKPLTKWERFAKEKGISHKQRDRMVFDDERQEWVKRWGRGGKNKEVEEQWIHEVKAGEDPDHDPAASAKKARKERVAKNEAQHKANLAHATAPTSTRSISAQNSENRSKRKVELERSMLLTKTSTASLGKFDKKIEGEPKTKGVKRKFEPNVGEDWEGEKGRAMDVLKGLDGKKKREGKGEGEINVRKAVRF
ncbi:hypothetical protein TREMEDRAFT_22893, partial [Tremella mesenterica DSM 1558]